MVRRTSPALHWWSGGRIESGSEQLLVGRIGAGIEVLDLLLEGGGADLLPAPDPTPAFAAEVAEQFDRLLARLTAHEPFLGDVARWKLEGFTNEEIAVRSGKLLADVAELDLFGGKLSAQITADADDIVPRYALLGRVENVEAGTATSSLFGSAILTGRATLALELERKGYDWIRERVSAGEPAGRSVAR